jgi:multicomponent Na+:H+ antiporter subunit G
MIFEWIKFGFTALFFAAALMMLFISILGTFRFRFALNRIHCAAINDTIVLMLFFISTFVAIGFDIIMLKFAIIILVQWCTCPLTSHMLTKAEYMTDEHIGEHCELPKEE